MASTFTVTNRQPLRQVPVNIPTQRTTTTTVEEVNQSSTILPLEETSYIIPKRATNIGLIIGSLGIAALIGGAIYYYINNRKRMDKMRRDIDDKDRIISEVRDTLERCQSQCLEQGCPPPTPCPPCNGTLPDENDITPSPPRTPIDNRIVRERQSQYKLESQNGNVYHCITTYYTDGTNEQDCRQVGTIEGISPFESDRSLEQKLENFVRKLKRNR